MAVDSKDKRYSMIGFGSVFAGDLLLEPDGTAFGRETERVTALGLYAGLSLAVVKAAVEVEVDGRGPWEPLDERFFPVRIALEFRLGLKASMELRITAPLDPVPVEAGLTARAELRLTPPATIRGATGVRLSATGRLRVVAPPEHLEETEELWLLGVE